MSILTQNFIQLKKQIENGVAIGSAGSLDVDAAGRGLLHSSIREGNEAAFVSLFKSGVASQTMLYPDSNGITPMMQSVASGQGRMTSTMKAWGAPELTSADVTKVRTHLSNLVTLNNGNAEAQSFYKAQSDNVAKYAKDHGIALEEHKKPDSVASISASSLPKKHDQSLATHHHHKQNKSNSGIC